MENATDYHSLAEMHWDFNWLYLTSLSHQISWIREYR